MPMLIWLTGGLAGLALLLWALVIFSPSNLRNRRFTYNLNHRPDDLNNAVVEEPLTDPWPGDPEQWPAVTVIAPGRNEGHVLQQTLGSLCQMTYPNYGVVFVDDQSSDNTADICAQLQRQYSHLRVIKNQTAPPTGWTGKVWAVHQADGCITTPYVLFTDSDMVHHPESLIYAMRLMLHRKLDLLTLLPWMTPGGAVEQAVMLTATLAIQRLAPLPVVNCSTHPMPLTAGAYMLFRTAAYDAVGRHAGIRGHIIEDLAIGRKTRSHGFKVFTTYSPDLLSGRMYEGLGDTFRGLKKNAYTGLNCSLPWAVVALTSLFSLGVLVPVYLLIAIAGYVVEPSMGWLVVGLIALALNLLFFIHAWRVRKEARQKPGVEFLLPLGVLFSMLTLIGSMWDYYVHGGSIWAGRHYSKNRIDHTAPILTADKMTDSR